MKTQLLKDLNLFPERIFYENRIYCKRNWFNGIVYTYGYFGSYKHLVIDFRSVDSGPHWGSAIVSKEYFWNLVDQGTIEVL